MRVEKQFQSEVLLDTRQARGAEARTKVGIVDEALERIGEGACVTGGDEHASLAVDDELRHTSDTGGHDWQPCRHRLEDRDGKSLAAARENEDVRRGEDLGNVVALTFEDDRLFDAEALRLSYRGVTVGTVADERCTVLAAEERKRAHERDRILRRLEPADRDDRGHPVARASAAGATSHRCRCGSRTCDVRRTRPRRRPAARSDSQTQIVAVVSGRTARSASRYMTRRDTGVRARSPAVNGEDSDGNAGQTSGDPPEDAGLRAIGMDDLRSQAPQEERELDDGRADPEARPDDGRAGARRNRLRPRPWPRAVGLAHARPR